MNSRFLKILFSILFFFIANKNLLALNQNLLDKIDVYLNNLNNITANFIESSSEGHMTEGIIYLSKPGKLRIEYKKKESPLIVADGKWIHFFDIELNEIQSVGIKKSPAWILLKEKVNLNKDFEVKTIKKELGKIIINISNKDFENINEIKLVFSSSPIALKKWIILDSQDIETTVSLTNIKEKQKFNPKTFILLK